MCGIAGYYSIAKLKKMAQLDAADIYAEMMLAIQDRGTDACGMFCVGNQDYAPDGGAYRFRRPGPAKDSIDTLWELAATSGSMPLVVGHTRRATGATPSRNRNNHPFNAGHLTGVHNGVFTNHRRVAAELNLPLTGDCDSEVIFQMLAQHEQAEDYVAELFTRLNDYNRVAFYDANTHLFHLYTQDTCGLCFVRDERSGVTWFASGPEYFPAHCREDHKWLAPQNLYTVRDWDKLTSRKAAARKKVTA